jgi:hypothetical protein
MKRVGNSRAISDIEFVIDAPSLGDSKRSWTAHGVECTRNRHKFADHEYAFTLEVVQLRCIKSRRLAWHAMIVTEWWHLDDPDATIRNTKWLKVLSGKGSDVTAWMRRSRAMKVDKLTESQAPELEVIDFDD